MRVSRIVGAPSRRITLTCFCAECTSIKWWANGQLISQSDYRVMDVKRKLGEDIFIRIKYSSYGIALYDRNLYSCSVTDTYGNETFQRKAYIEGIRMLLYMYIQVYSWYIHYTILLHQCLYSIDPKVTVAPQTMTKVPGENASITCNSTSTHFIKAEWLQKPVIWFNTSGLVTTQRSHDGIHYVLNSTINFRITPNTPHNFKIHCRIISAVLIQPFNFKEKFVLYYKGFFIHRMKQTHISTGPGPGIFFTVNCKFT